MMGVGVWLLCVGCSSHVVDYLFRWLAVNEQSDKQT